MFKKLNFASASEGEDEFRYFQSRLNKTPSMSSINLGSPSASSSGANSGKIFGGPIPDPLPQFFSRALHYIEANGVKEQGLFRLSGELTDIQTYKSKIEQGEQVDFKSVNNIHTVTGLVKLYLRELAEPAFTFKTYAPLIAAEAIQDDDERAVTIKRHIESLPSANNKLLRTLFLFLNRIAKHEEHTNMGPANLAIVFAPNLLRPQTSALENMLKDTTVTIAIIATIIDEAEFFFEYQEDEKLTEDDEKPQAPAPAPAHATVTVSNNNASVTSATTTTAITEKASLASESSSGEQSPLRPQKSLPVAPRKELPRRPRSVQTSAALDTSAQQSSTTTTTTATTTTTPTGLVKRQTINFGKPLPEPPKLNRTSSEGSPPSFPASSASSPSPSPTAANATRPRRNTFRFNIIDSAMEQFMVTHYWDQAVNFAEWGKYFESAGELQQARKSYINAGDTLFYLQRQYKVGSPEFIERLMSDIQRVDAKMVSASITGVNPPSSYPSIYPTLPLTSPRQLQRTQSQPPPLPEAVVTTVAATATATAAAATATAAGEQPQRSAFVPQQPPMFDPSLQQHHWQRMATSQQPQYQQWYKYQQQQQQEAKQREQLARQADDIAKLHDQLASLKLRRASNINTL